MLFFIKVFIALNLFAMDAELDRLVVAKPQSQSKSVAMMATAPPVPATKTARPTPTSAPAPTTQTVMATPARTTQPKPTAHAACATLSFDELRKRGPRPAVLASLVSGDCVTVRFASGESTYVWRPSGTRFSLGNSMYARWADGLVSVYRKDGKFVANEFFKGKQQELELERKDGKLMLPASHSFIFAESGDAFIALVDVLVKR